MILGWVVGVCIHAQEASPPQWWGVFGGWSLLDHRANMPIYEGQPECGSFTRGRASGLLLGISYDRPLAAWFEGSARLVFWQRPARLEFSSDNGLEAYDPEQDEYVPFVRRHVWEASLWYAGIEISGRLYPFRAVGMTLPLWLRIGADVAHPAFGADYEQTEEIVQPRALLFPDGTRRHTLASGAIPDAATTAGALAAIGATFPLRPRVELTAEAGIRYGLNSLRSTQEWMVHAAFATIGMRFDLVAAPESPPPPPPPPQPPPPRPPSPVTLQVATPEPVLVQEAIVTETFPLLPYVFFDSASAELPVRYLPLIDRATFADSALPRSTLGIYYHLLHILGRRLASDPSAVLTVTGTTDGIEVPPAQQASLARARAEAIAAYLRAAWKVRPEQVIVATSSAPSIPSNPAYPEGVVENRRAELSSSSPTLFGPIVHERFREYVVQRRRIALRMAELPTGVQQWELRIRYRSTDVGSRAGNGTPPELIAFELDSAALASVAGSVAPRDSLECEVWMHTASGQDYRAQCAIPIERTQSKFERSRLSLVVFDFDRADLSPTNRELVRRFVLDAVKPTSRIRITGTTDRLGEAAYNLQLSQARAEEAHRFIQQLVPTARIEEVRGIGASRLLFDNNIPEGRYYCRTVTILVETPL